MPAPSGLLDRVLGSPPRGFPPELARYVMSLQFTEGDRARYAALSRKAQEGTLAKEERAELDEFLSINDLIALLQSRARSALARRNPAA